MPADLQLQAAMVLIHGLEAELQVLRAEVLELRTAVAKAQAEEAAALRAEAVYRHIVEYRDSKNADL